MTSDDPTAPGARIEVRDLTKRFGSFTAVDDLTLHRRARPDHRLPRPERRRQDHHPADAARAWSARPAAPPPSAASATTTSPRRMAVVGSALEATNFHPGRTGRDHLRVLADTGGVGTARVDEMLELVGIPAAARKRAGGYSHGHAPAPRPGRGAARRPAGADPRRAGQRPRPRGHPLAARLPAPPASQGKTVLVSSHMLQEVEQTVDDVVIISNGRLVKQGAMADLHGEAGVHRPHHRRRRARRRPAGRRR